MKDNTDYMKRKAHEPEEIVRKLRNPTTKLVGGRRSRGSAWRRCYGGTEEGTVTMLKELQKENARVKLLVANEELDIVVLIEINAGKWRSRRARRWCSTAS